MTRISNSTSLKAILGIDRAAPIRMWCGSNPMPFPTPQESTEWIFLWWTYSKITISLPLDLIIFVSENTASFIFIYPIPQPLAGCDTRSIFKPSTTGLNSEFSFSWINCLTKAKELYYLMTVGETGGFKPFSRALVRSETPTNSSRIWFRVKLFVLDRNTCNCAIYLY